MRNQRTFPRTISAAFGLLLASFAIVWLSLPAVAAPKADAPKSDALEDRPEPFVPKHPRSEARSDQLEAGVLLATARTLQQREEQTAALRLYQRAIRLDSQAVAALQEIVPLAYGLKRSSEAMRYAVALAEQDDSDPDLVRRVGFYLGEAGKWKQAIAMLERAQRLEEAAAIPPADLAKDLAQIHAELARLYLLEDRPADAAAALDKMAPALRNPKEAGLDAETVKALVGDGGQTYELMGEAYLEAGRPADAATAFAELNRIAPNAAEFALNTARVDAKQNHPAEALNGLQKYLDSRPAELELATLELLAKVRSDLKQSDRLVPQLEKLHRALPDSVALNYFLAEQYRKAGKPAEARPFYEAVVKKKPVGEAYRALAAIYRQAGSLDELLKLLGDIAEKAESFEILEAEGKAIVADDKLSTALFQLARTNHAAAAEANYPALLGAAMLAAQRKQLDVEGEFYNLAARALPNKAAEPLLTWGLDLSLAEKHDEAARVFRRGIEEGALPPDRPAFEYYLAGELEMAGKTEAALEVARKMAAARPHLETRFAARTGWILYHAKRYDEADRNYMELLALRDADYSSDENREALRDVRSVLSNIASIRHKPAEAEEWLQQILDEFSDDPGAQNDLGFLWADENKHLDRALAMIRHAVEAEPKNAAYLDSLGWVLFRLGRLDEAKSFLQKAVAAEKPEPEVLEHLGDILAADKRPQEAGGVWIRALNGYKEKHDDEKAHALQEKIEKVKSK